MKSKLFMTATLGLLLFMTGCGVVVYEQHGWHHHHRHYYSAALSGALVAPGLEAQSAALASDYGLKAATAQKIFYIMNSKTPTQDLANLNIDPRDIAALAKLKMPSDVNVHNVALALGEDEDVVAQLMADYISDIKNEDNK